MGLLYRQAVRPPRPNDPAAVVTVDRLLSDEAAQVVGGGGGHCGGFFRLTMVPVPVELGCCHTSVRLSRTAIMAVDSLGINPTSPQPCAVPSLPPPRVPPLWWGV